MTDLINMPADQVRELAKTDPDAFVESFAQMLYDHAERAGDAEDNAITEAIKDRYNTKMQTYFGAAEYVRGILRD